MVAAKDTPVSILVRFSRLVASVPTPLEILPMLADAAIEHLAADAAAVVRVAEAGRLELAAARRLPAELAAIDPDLEIGDIAAWLVRSSHGRFATSRTLLLVSSSDLFGALVLLFPEPTALDGERLELAAGLVDLAAVALGKAFQFAELQRSFLELKASREVLVRTEKLRALGQAAAGIAHDLKNILNPLGLQLEILKRKLPPDSSLGAVAEGMERVLQRGIETVERLREFSRQSPGGKRTLIDLNYLIRETTELALPRLHSRSGLQLEQDLGDPPAVLLEPSEFVTALLNLVVNSIDASPDHGVITIRSGAGDGGSWVRVEDEGAGIPPEVERHIFEPFFTTKGKQGTGLGLAMVYAFVQRHGGKISLETGANKGTAFTMWFPAVVRRSSEAAS